VLWVLGPDANGPLVAESLQVREASFGDFFSELRDNVEGLSGLYCGFSEEAEIASISTVCLEGTVGRVNVQNSTLLYFNESSGLGMSVYQSVSKFRS